MLYHHLPHQNRDVTIGGDIPSSMDHDNVQPTIGIMVNESFGDDGDHNVQPSSPTSVKVVLPDSEDLDMQLFVRTHRHSLLVDDKQDLMIGCAWTTPPEKRLFKMFGEVLHIDCTADTNYEDRPFLTITGRDSNGKMFTVIRAFLPNECAWVFRWWLFQTVMPSLLGREFIGRVKVIVTDGDSQETSQLDIAIALHFQNVCRVRCGWHVVDRGWIRCCPGVRSVSRENQAAFKASIIQIKAWLYSWMHTTCESEEEYRKPFLLHICIHLLLFPLLRSLWQSASDCSSVTMWSLSKLSSVFIAVATSATTTHTPTLHMREPTMD